MSLAFSNINGEPQVHALIIGVGAYHYLNDGKDALVQTHPAALALRQLQSPPLSAVALYEAIIGLDVQHKLSLPLGSIAFLASQIPGSNSIPPTIMHVLDPTFDNIAVAFDEWLVRCESNPRNIAILYFCGHGAQHGDQFLLTADFGSRVNAPFEGSFNIDQTMLALGQRKIDNQFILIDSCRQMLNGTLATKPSVRNLLDMSLVGKDFKNLTSFKAAVNNELALAPLGQVSYFTKAVINGMSGAASKLKRKKWVVSTSQLSMHMDMLLNLEKPGSAEASRYEANQRGSFDLCVSDFPTKRKVILTCDPDSALPTANLECIEVDGKYNNTRPPDAQPWEFETEAGFYRINATFANGYVGKQDQINIEAPLNEDFISCETIL